MSVSTLALAAQNPAALPAAIPGTPRTITVVNTGTVSAQGVALDLSVVLPVGTTIISTCGTLAPLASCTFTITPGAVATAAPVALPIQGNNTNVVTPTVEVLAYGSVYQGGYVFAIDDATPNTGSVSGKVAAMSDSPVAPVPWSPDIALIAGIDQLAAAPCAGATDGACNTNAIVAYYNGLAVSPTTYAAGLCASSAADGHADWYLPAVCEAGYEEFGVGTGCGSSAAPSLQNIRSNLAGKVVIPPGFYWTSTTLSAAPANAWAVLLQATGPSLSMARTASNGNKVRCVRAISY